MLSLHGFAVCSLFTLYLGGSPVIYSTAPRGNCPSCCPIRERRDIRFFLYTRTNPHYGDVLYVNDDNSFHSSHYNLSRPLVIYLHGFSEHVPGGPGQSSQEMRDAFVKYKNYNIVLVDWSPITAIPWYIQSLRNIPRVAKYLAHFILFLIKMGVDTNRIHLIGFSLGADVAGYAGRLLKAWNHQVSRITGLDPAFSMPMFSQRSKRLNANDAEFVDIIHTDGGVLGNLWQMGDADFFPNQGIPLQPGCAKQEFMKNRWYSIVVGCSHQRSWEYFIESIQSPKAFLAVRCEPTEASINSSLSSCDESIKAYMGMNANKRLRGKYYLTTNSAPPYGKNIEQAKDV